MDNNQKFRSIVGAILGLAEGQVTDDLSPDTVDAWDSLNHINLIGALEQEFGVTLTTEDLTNSQSVSQLKALLAKYDVAV